MALLGNHKLERDGGPRCDVSHPRSIAFPSQAKVQTNRRKAEKAFRIVWNSKLESPTAFAA